MAVAYDAQSSQAVTSGDQSWNHTPVGTPAGVLVILVEETGTDIINGVTYSGQAMVEVPLSPIHYTSPETGTVHAFFLDAPTDTNEAAVAVDTSAAGDWIGACFSVTSATGHAEVHDTSTRAGAAGLTTVSATLTITKDSFVAGGLYSGLGAPGFTEVSGTQLVVEGDLGGDSGGISRGNSIKTADFAYSWDQSSDDGMALVVALCEKANATIANAGLASGTAASNATRPTIAPAAGLASATATAYGTTFQPSKAVDADLATATALANATSPTIAPVAGLAAATASALAPVASIAPAAGLATAAATAYGATAVPGEIGSADLATATAAALAVSASIAPVAGVAAASAEGLDASPTIAPTAGLAVAAATAYDATATTATATVAQAELASATAAALAGAVAVGPNAAAAAAISAAYDASGTVGAFTGLASASATAHDVSWAVSGGVVTATAGLATGTATAYPVTFAASSAAGGRGPKRRREPILPNDDDEFVALFL